MRSICLLLVLFCLLNPASADDLISTYQLAERFDPQFKAATATFYAEQQAVPENRANLLPLIYGNAGIGRTNSEIEGSNFFSNLPNREEDSDELSYGIYLEQSIYDHSLWQRLAQADARAAQAAAEYETERQNLILRVAEAYFRVLAAKDNLEFTTAEKNSVEKQLEQAKQQFEVGLIASIDVKESQAQYDQAVANEIEAENILSTNQEALWTLTQTYAETLAPLVEDIPLLPPEPTDKQQWVDKAIIENTSLRAADYAVLAAEKEVNIQRSGHYPTLDFNAARQFSDTDGGNFGAREQTDTSFGITLNIPIYQGGGVSARTKTAVYRLHATREQYEATRRQTIQQTRDAYQNVIAEISRVKALKQALDSSQAAYEATQAGFEVGTRNSVDVFISLRNKFRAERDYASTRYKYILNTLRLKQAAGNLSVNDLYQINRWLK